MTQPERWLAATWPVVRAALPAPPARVVELGCGRVGGHVPAMRAAGYDALGVDPEAPAGDEYRRIEFERLDERVAPLEAVVASTSLHHVADPAQVLDAIARLLAPEGRMIVVEWDWESFDEHTADWCFARLPAGEDGWLHHHRAAWAASGRPWSAYLRGWAEEHGIHAAGRLLDLLGERFRLGRPAYRPYFFADLAETAEADEQAAIDAGEIRATRLQVVGQAV
jgi:SAM-dependent methyltransferase